MILLLRVHDDGVQKLTASSEFNGNASLVTTRVQFWSLSSFSILYTLSEMLYLPHAIVRTKTGVPGPRIFQLF